MTYEVLYIDNGDVLAEYESLEAAQRQLVSFVEQHPELRDEIGVVALDDSGHAVGEPHGAAEFA